MKRKLTITIGIFCTLLVLVAVSLITGCQPSTTGQVEWKAVTGDPMNHYYTLLYEEMIDNIKEKTNGMFTINLFVSATLYPPNEHFTACTDGLVELCSVPGGYVAPNLPLMGISDLPMLFSSSSEMLKFYDNDKVRGILDPALLDVGVMNLGPVGDFGGIYLMAIDKIETMEDLAGVPIRAGGKWASKAVQALGGSGVSIGPEERYTAMQRGTVRGEITSVSNHVAQKMHEITRYAIKSPAIIYPDKPVYVNANAYNALPKQYQKILTDEYAKLASQARKKVLEDLEGNWEVMQNAGVQFIDLSDNEIARWQEVLKPMWAEWVAEVGPDGQNLLNLALESK